MPKRKQIHYLRRLSRVASADDDQLELRCAYTHQNFQILGVEIRLLIFYRWRYFIVAQQGAFRVSSQELATRKAEYMAQVKEQNFALHAKREALRQKELEALRRPLEDHKSVHAEEPYFLMQPAVPCEHFLGN